MKRGRPLKEMARRKTVTFRLSDDEYDMLLKKKKKVGKPISEIARKGVIMSAVGESDLYDLQHN